MLILFIILIVVVVVNDDTYYWVYWSFDHQFQVYYNVRQLLLQGATVHYFYYKVHWSVITKCDSFFYFKERQVLLQSATILLQSVLGITKCDRTVYREKYRKISFFILAKKGWVVAVRFFYFGMPVRRLFEDDPMR